MKYYSIKTMNTWKFSVRKPVYCVTNSTNDTFSPFIYNWRKQNCFILFSAMNLIACTTYVHICQLKPCLMRDLSITTSYYSKSMASLYSVSQLRWATVWKDDKDWITARLDNGSSCFVLWMNDFNTIHAPHMNTWPLLCIFVHTLCASIALCRTVASIAILERETENVEECERVAVNNKNLLHGCWNGDMQNELRLFLLCCIINYLLGYWKSHQQRCVRCSFLL